MTLVACTEPTLRRTSPATFEVGAPVHLYEGGTYDVDTKTGVLATVYADAAGTVELTQPLTTDESGLARGAGDVYGYVQAGEYDPVVNGRLLPPWQAAAGRPEIGDVVGLEEALEGKAEVPTEVPRSVTANSGTSYQITSAEFTFLTLTTATPQLLFPSAAAAVPVIQLFTIQDGTGGRKPIWPGARWATPGGKPPAPSPNPGEIDAYELVALGKGEWLVIIKEQGFSLDSYLAITKGISGLVFFGTHNDSGSTLTDLSGAGNNGTYTGAPALVEGGLTNSGLSDAAAKARRFNNGPYASVPDSASLDVADDFTIVVRIKLLGGSGTNRGVLARGTGGCYLKIDNTGQARLEAQNEKVVAYGGVVPEDGKWHTLVFGKSGKTVVSEMDGVNTLAGPPAEFTMKATATPMIVGAGSTSGDKGNQDQHTLLFNRLLTEAERQLLHHSASGAEVRPTLEYDFEDGTLKGFNTSGVGEGPKYPVVQGVDVLSGTKSLLIECAKEQERNEVTLGGDGGGGDNPIRFVEGDHFFYEFDIDMAVLEVWGGPGHHMLFFQLKGQGEGGPMLSLHLWDSSGKQGLYVSNQNRVVGQRDKYVAPFALATKHHVKIEFVASCLGAGMYKIWLDEALVDEDSGINTFPTGKPFAYIKNGAYRGAKGIYAGLLKAIFDNFKLTPA